MTNLTRPATLSLRRPTAQALTTSRASKASAPAAVPSAERSSGDAQPETLATGAIRSDTLLQGRSHISIMHNGETYQLRATRLGKLILTK
jgi:hemin uptake protein HemP